MPPPSCCASVSPSRPSSLRATAGGQWSGGYRGVCSAPQTHAGHPCDAPNPSWSLQSCGQAGKGQTSPFPNSLWLLFAAPHPERCHHPNFSQIWLSPWVLHERGTGQTASTKTTPKAPGAFGCSIAGLETSPRAWATLSPSGGILWGADLRDQGRTGHQNPCSQPNGALGERHGRVGSPTVEKRGGKPQVPAGLQEGDVLQDHT